MKKLTSIILAVVMMVSAAAVFAACSKSNTDDKTDASATEAASDLAYIQSKGKMIVGITEYKPMNYKDSDGSWTGFDTEFAQAVGEKLGVDVEFVVIDWDNKWSELKSKSLDAVWNGMTITDEVKQNASVTNAYVKNAQVVVMNKDNASKFTAESTLEDMKDITFAVESGSAGEGALKDAGMTNYTAVTAQSDALMEVQSGSADACVIDLTMANSMTGEGTSYADLQQVISLNEEDYGIAFRTDSDMTEKVNALMDEMKADGSLKKLADKYSLTLA